VSDPSSLKELGNLREEVELRLKLKALKSSNIQQSEVDELRKEVVLLRCRVDDNAGEIKKKINEGIRPEFVSIPQTGEICNYTSLGRSKLYDLIASNKDNGFKPLVESVSLRQPGSRSGKRLIVLKSLLAYLYKETERFQESIRKEAPSE